MTEFSLKESNKSNNKKFTPINKQSLEEVKNYLKNGIWVSKEYEQILIETKSKAKTNNLITTYTELIFDGENSIHCNKPSFMEEDVYTLFENLKVGHNLKDVAFIVHQVSENSLLIIDRQNIKHEYFKLTKKIVKNKILHIINEGTYEVFNNWFSGKYLLTFKTGKSKTITFNKNNIQFWDWSIHHGELVDIIKINGDYYKVDNIINNTYSLEEVEAPELDLPLKFKNNKVTLKKIN